MRAFKSTSVSFLALLTVGATVSPAMGQTKTFTLDADFDAGVLTNTQHVPSNQIVLGPTSVSKTRLVWVSNTAPGGSGATPLSPGWIVRINTTIGPDLGRQTARFDSVLLNINGQPTGGNPSGNNPGRVAVDTNGDVWIVNRAYYEGAKQGTLSKFSGNIAHCIDRNNNGVIDTSYDANGDGIIDPYKTPALGTPANEVEYFAQNDECILSTIKVGAVGDIPRAVAVDRNGKIWVGTHTGHTVYRYNPNEPVALEASRSFTANSPFPFVGWFYSAATADDYVYFTSNPGWSAASGTGQIVRIKIDDVNQVDSVVCGGGTGTCGSVYGIVAVPGTHQAWAGGYSGTGVYKVNFDATPPTCTCIAVPAQVTAVTLDLNGKVWASGYNTGNVYRINPTTNAIEATCATGGSNPHGLSVDFDGYIWSVQDNPNHLVRFDPVATANNCGRAAFRIDRGALPIPAGQSAYGYTPYLYSDFTGVQIDRQAPYTRVGAWDGTYDGGAEGMPWKEISWNAEPQGGVPNLTSLVVSVRAGDTLAALGQAVYTEVSNPASLAGTVGRYIQVKADLAGPGYLTPVLSDLTVKGPCDTVGESCCITASDCNDGNLCTVDACPAPGGSCTHTSIAQCCLTDADCGDGNQCTADTCPAPGAFCVHSSLPNCCMSYADCNDNDLCTADICPSPGGSCGNVAIPGCCHTVADCDDGSLCTIDVCPADGELCEHIPIADCCLTDADCADNNLCTTNTCDQTSHSCQSAPIADCCNEDAECFDGNECTSDRCSGLGGVCVYPDIPGCCTAESPEVGQPCDEPVAPKDHPPCKAGAWVCVNHSLVCEGAIEPEVEQCDWIDNDCDGNIDAPDACPIGKTCINGICADPCKSGEFPCDGGYQCVNGLCLPTSCDEVICQEGYSCAAGLCTEGDAGTAGSGGAGGSGGVGGTGGSGATGGTAGSGGSGPATDGGDAPDGSTAGSGGEQHDRAENYGLVTGGGGCACGVAGESSPASRAWAGLALAMLATWVRRRRARGGR